jgi:hypothetical protein
LGRTRGDLGGGGFRDGDVGGDFGFSFGSGFGFKGFHAVGEAFVEESGVGHFFFTHGEAAIAERRARDEREEGSVKGDGRRGVFR